jgi:hypothetical protein
MAGCPQKRSSSATRASSSSTERSVDSVEKKAASPLARIRFSSIADRCMRDLVLTTELAQVLFAAHQLPNNIQFFFWATLSLGYDVCTSLAHSCSEYTSQSRNLKSEPEWLFGSVRTDVIRSKVA